MTKIKPLLHSILPEERKNWIPCVSFGAAMLVLIALNIWKWVAR